MGRKERDLAQRAAILTRIFRVIVPRVDGEMARWEAKAQTIPHPELRRQALASLRGKSFHAEGGGVYAALAPTRTADLVPLIVALQTISDYLDNLCDRGTSRSGDDFRCLHQAMLDAVDPGRPVTGDYYARHPHRDDGGYLSSLVACCRHHLSRLPAYAAVREEVIRLVTLFNDLQVYKHIAPARRESCLQAWFAPHHPSFRDLHWWEFAAASGSTLAVFALFAAATRPETDPQTARCLRHAYFPWICGLHILLDYLIDQDEDGRGGDLNFIRYYRCPSEIRTRLLRFYRRARMSAGTLPDRAFHALVVDGLVALYLSDDKVKGRRLPGAGRELLHASAPYGPLLVHLCSWQRRLRNKM